MLMENKEVEVITINNRDLMVLDEDDEVIYTTNVDNNNEVVILKKVKNSDDIFELNEVESIKYLEKFLKKYNNMKEVEK